MRDEDEESGRKGCECLAESAQGIYLHPWGGTPCGTQVARI